MTSSLYIKKRIEEGQRWQFGSEFDHYIQPFGDCHPDFKAIPMGPIRTSILGSPDKRPVGGFKMCVRRPPPKREEHKIDNGFFIASPNLYDPYAKTPTQINNPQNPWDRRMPGEGDLMRNDYLRLGVRYDGTGIRNLHIPRRPRDIGRPYYQYGMSFTPHEADSTWATRVATSRDDNVPPPKEFDVTHLIQPYEVWKNEDEHFRRQ